MQKSSARTTLIIRCWYEPESESGSVLRGSIEQVQTGERVYFQTAAELQDKLNRFLDPFPGPDGTGPVPGEIS